MGTAWSGGQALIRLPVNLGGGDKDAELTLHLFNPLW